MCAITTSAPMNQAERPLLVTSDPVSLSTCAAKPQARWRRSCRRILVTKEGSMENMAVPARA
jgi:hypothetical protein